MKRARAKRWVAALRSGKYKQGRDHLRKGDRYCCLGVLCDISKLSEWDRMESGIYNYMGAEGPLPRRVREWSGVRDALGGFIDDRGLSLADLNDDGKRFSTIAKVIEKHWKEL